MKRTELKTACAILVSLFVVAALACALGARAYAAGPDGYTWVYQNPIPNDQFLYSTSAAAANRVWAVGRYGTIMYWNGTALTKQASGTTNDLNDVFAYNTTHVWSVGEGATILFYNGTSWSKQTAPTLSFSYDLWGVSAADSSHVWAVGGYDGFNNAVILFYNGTSWAVQKTMDTGGFTDVCAYDTSHVWAVSNWTWSYNGSSWSQVNDGSGYKPYQVSAYSGSNVWAVDWDGTILKSTNGGATWIAVLSGLDWPTTVFALDATHIWIVGWEGNTGFYSGSGWSYAKMGTSGLCGVDAFASNSIFACGESVFYTNTGTLNWTSRTGGITTNTLYGVVSYGVDEVWAVGDSGTIVHSSDGGNIWGSQSSGVSNSLRAVSAADQNTLWAVGDTGTVRRTTNGGSSWNYQSLGLLNFTNLYGAYAVNTSTVWVVGASGRIYKTTNGGLTWSRQASGLTSNIIEDVYAVDTSTAWAVGDGGFICKTVNGGSNWTAQSSGTTNNLYAIKALDANRAWAAGAGGTVLYTSNGGTNWTAQANPSGGVQLNGVTAVDASHVWAVGNGGLILYNDGTGWATQTSPTTRTLNWVSAWDASDVWAVGEGGTILFADPPYIKTVGHGWGDPGDTVDVEVIGAYTNFQASDPVLSFGDGVNAVPGSVEVVDNTHILARVQVDSGAALGPRDVNAVTVNQTPIPLKGGFVVGSNPTVASVGPASAIRGWTGNVRIKGSQTDFGASSEAVFGSGIKVNSLTCKAVDEAIANITVRESAAPGPRSVNVITGKETPAPLADGFSVATPPAVTGVSPEHGSAGTRVTITGNRFGPDRWAGWNKGFSKVEFNGVSATGLASWSDSRIEVMVPDGARSGRITVKTVDGSSNRVKFAINNPAPTVAGLDPGRRTAGSGGFTITVNGAGFVRGSVVRWNGSNRAATYVSSTKLTASIRAADVAGTGTAAVTVFNPAPGGGTSNVKTFTINAGPPRPQPPVGESDTWYLAEGCTAYGFDCRIAVENPNQEPVTVKPTFMTYEGSVTKTNLKLPGYSSRVIDPRKDYGLVGDFSTRIECLEKRPIAVDRTMYWAGEEAGGIGDGGGAGEGHSSIGVSSPANTWYLPEGSSAWGFECWLTIQNPGSSKANCEITYMIEGARPVRVNKVVHPGSRGSFNIADDIGTADTSIMVSSDVPVVTERSMYRHNRKVGSNSTGATSPAVDYYLSEGTTAWGFTTYVLVQNPNTVPAEVTITYMTPSGARNTAPRTVPAGSRKTIRVNDEAPDTDLSIKAHGSQPIIIERAMYWEGAGGEACHDSIGVSLPHRIFMLPGGLAGRVGGRRFETWTVVQNPNDREVRVRISYLAQDAKGNAAFEAVVPANSRRSYNMGDKLVAGNAGVMVESLTPGRNIIVERSTYGNQRGIGVCTIGGFSD